ncbi:MAG: glycoside hydrolase family 38 N-terminal domain-containing protein [Armatimonadota bacterium]
MSSETGKSLDDFKGKIHVIGYTHADIGWVHTREWHIDRYVRAVDEILDMMDKYPDYCYYIDTWTELMIPYIKLRPENLDRIRAFIRNGQMAICGGHYGNVRSTNVGDETFVRNLQLGMKHWREFEPEVNLMVYADMDVTLGHTQTPQLLRLAGISGYFAMRPLEALDSEGVPRDFYWKGLSGDTVLMCRALYGGLFMMSERHGPTWDTDWDAVKEGIWKGYLERPVQDNVDNVALCVGSDDTRPDRFLLGNDEMCNYRDLMNIWNEREGSKMVYSTPDRLFSALDAEGEKLQTLDKILDPTDVSYNTANHGRRGIWWLREKSDRSLVQGEVFNALAGIVKGTEYPQGDYTAMWEKLLDWTPHAVQYLFRQDWQAGELDLMKTIGAADKQMVDGYTDLANGCLPMDAEGVALLNSIPGTRNEIIPMWVVNTDLTRDLGRLVDAKGNEVQFQVVDYPVCNAELNIMADVKVPGCGYTSLKFEWDPVPPKPANEADITNAETAPYWRNKYSMFDKCAVEDEVFEIASDRVKMTLKSGHIVSVEDLATGVVRTAPEGASFLEPVTYSVKKENWYTEGIADDPERFTVDEVRWDQAGPLLWRITRTGKVGGYWIRQNIDLLKGESGVRSTVHFMDPADNIGSFIAMSLPISDSAKIDVDIPFGIEPRNFDEIKYGTAERAIPGFFWGRTWANASDDAGQVALVTEDGDKFFRVYGTPRRLIHFMAQKTKAFETSWEAYIDTYDVGGRQVFQHRMMLGAKDQPVLDLVKIAEQIRHPVRCQYVPASEIGVEKEYLKVSPSTVRMNAFTYDGNDVIIRLTQMSGESASAEIELPFVPSSTDIVDLNGSVISGDLTSDGSSIRFTIKPWQIATLRIKA